MRTLTTFISLLLLMMVLASSTPAFKKHKTTTPKKQKTEVKKHKKKARQFDETYRPQFHFSPEKNWQNDPNGLVYYKGEYHMFYQYNPNGKEWGYMHWGHTVSSDLVHWQHLPIAIYPDNDSNDKSYCTAFSGSAIIDQTNLLRLQDGKELTLVAFYTSFQCGQRIAYSNDKGRTWKKYSGNPVIPYDETDDARDPKVFWHEPSKKWVMCLYRKPQNQERSRGVSFYVSENLVNWELKSHIPGFYECPDLIELKVNNRPDDKKWVLFDGDGSYIIGNFTGDTFVPETGKLPGDFGKNYYATQTWSNIPSSDGRTIQIAWMKDGEFPDMPFKGQMTFPCELSLKKFNNGLRLIREPVSEINLLHEKHYKWRNKNLIPGINENMVKKLRGNCFHIRGVFDLKTADAFGFLFNANKKQAGTELLYNVKRGTLTCLGSTIPIEPIDNKIYLEILIDRSSIEVFANNGRAVMSNCYTPDPDGDEVKLINTGGELLVEQLDIYSMNSIWPLQKKEKKSNDPKENKEK
jgi:fructan beta-fructosidase